MSDLTPMMAQYASIKERHADAIVFFRLGDFYEMFRGDAREASHLLGLTLTSRQGVPMCGVPHHAAKGYIARLLQAGRKVAICEQVQTPAGRGLADREVVEVVTPGTVTEEEFLEATSNNYLVSLAALRSELSMAYIDLSTGELALSGCPLEEAANHARRELARLQPREVLIQHSLLENEGLARALGERSETLVNRIADWNYDLRSSQVRLQETLGVVNLKAFGLDADSCLPLAAGTLLDYVRETARAATRHVRSLRVDTALEYVGLDESTLRNLEVVANLHDGSRRYTLFEALNHTRTAMGARQLRRWLLAPLRELQAIRDRQTQVADLYRRQRDLAAVRDRLGGVLDLERLVARVAMERAHAKDLVALASSLDHCLQAYDQLLAAGLRTLRFVSRFDEQTRRRVGSLRDLIGRAIMDEPSTLPNEGGIIRDGYSEDLDAARRLRDGSRKVLEQYIAEERSASGLTTLKLRYNRVLGHFLEVTRSQAERVPSHFVRRQSLANAERFTTERLADLESSINDAAERIVDLERDLFIEIRSAAAAELEAVSDVAALVCELDVLQCLAFAATVHGYNAPEITTDHELRIRGGRHPVVEAYMAPGSFVPNSLTLSPRDGFFALITGPNMAGKSTFLRQTALIVLLAQIGSFVPAESATVGIADRIYCRVGASDNLARGESTFLVEMNEAAFILRTATAASLVIMDEIGRGTGTNDGLAIAQAVTEYLLGSVRPRTLFATHFHELTSMSAEGLMNLSLRVAEEEGRIVFLRQVVSGPSNNSYGIHVAEIAGLPAPVVARARQVLGELLERTCHGPPPATAGGPAEPGQDGLFEPAELILEELRRMDLDRLRPVDAVSRLARWQQELAGT